jgi:hypothetical protein
VFIAAGADRRALTELNSGLTFESGRRVSISKEEYMPGNLAAILVLGALAPVTASTQSAQPSVVTRAVSVPTAAIHATRGVVKAIDEAALVVSRPRNRGDITFTLSAATHRDGKIVIGSTVSVRYRDDGKNHVATAIALQKP